MKTWKTADLLSTLGGLTALAGFFLRFDSRRALFDILRDTPFPFLSPLLVLLMALSMALRSRFPDACQALALALLLGCLFLLGMVLWVFSPTALGALGPGALLSPLGLLALVLCPA